MDEVGMEEAEANASTRSNRFWLYTPIALLVLVGIAWSIAWFVIRNRTNDGLDAWLAAEARGGRQWTCLDRKVGGFPFRVEIICESLSLKQGNVSASLGRVESVAQVYQPRFVITEIDGPLNVTDGIVTLKGTWDLLQTSVHATPDGLQRASLVAEAPNFTITGLGPTELGTSSAHFEAHLRPNPTRAAEGAYDVAINTRQARIPALDNLIGGGEPTDLQLDATATQAQGFRGRPVIEELERWRAANGKVDILMLSLTKGNRRLEGKGELRLDDLHRPTGQFEIAAAGLDGLLGNATGNRATGALLGALLGQGQRQQNGDKPKLIPLPPLRIDNGKLAMGPFVIPGVRLLPLY
ncbi:DUF2125 domain-containing protein [Microvirga sp. 2MCAF38]|uniref:DUF2125 domain-containing protein n=1 Tax=Microvirga sp. 2MCAF38 TaxID=3232989 RepID=UPI003F9C84DE